MAGMILADFGADVVRVDRVNASGLPAPDILARGKRSIAIDPKARFPRLLLVLLRRKHALANVNLDLSVDAERLCRRAKAGRASGCRD